MGIEGTGFSFHAGRMTHLGVCLETLGTVCRKSLPLICPELALVSFKLLGLCLGFFSDLLIPELIVKLASSVVFPSLHLIS